MTNQLPQTMYGTTEGRASMAGRHYAGRGGVWALVFAGLVLLAGTHSVVAKSLYVIAERLDSDQKVQLLVCDIGSDGNLTRQSKRAIPLYGAGAIDLALDAASGHLFVSNLSSNVITIIDTATLKEVGTVKAQGATNMTGIVYDNDKGLLYCAARGGGDLYLFRWDPATRELTPTPESPVLLPEAETYGIALDEVRDELYVGSLSSPVRVYSTADWRLLRKIDVNRAPLCVAVDPIRNYLFYGGGLVEDYFLVRHDLRDGTEKEVQIAALAGPVGIAVDLYTGFVFTSTGSSECYCGRDLLSFTSDLVLVDSERLIAGLGNPGGVVLPDGHISYNPLHLTKTVKTSSGSLTVSKGTPQVVAGEELTYAISFDHNDLPLTEVSLVDTLPPELEFVWATGHGTYGQYDAKMHRYTWTNPPLAGGPQKSLEIVCRVDANVRAGQTITNSVTMSTREAPPTTAVADIVTAAAETFKPLHLSKMVLAGTTGGDETTLPSAYAGDEITYRLSFDNYENQRGVQNVRLTDVLPREMTFVRATGDILFGRYDPNDHSYTWTYPQLAAGGNNFVDLTVRLKDDVAGGTTITNAATIVSDETPATRTSASLAVANFTPLWLQKTLGSGAVGGPDARQRPIVDAGSTITYAIFFSNPVTNKTVTQVTVVDTLPRGVTFVSADGDREFGSYDAGTDVRPPTYTWRYPSLTPGGEMWLNLTVRVSDRLDPNAVLTNLVTIDSVQTPPTQASLDVVVRAAPAGALQLQKTLVAGAIGQPDSRGRFHVNAGSNITYALVFRNPATNQTATQVSIVDTLPRDVTFVSADGDRQFGFYDSSSHTYTWRYDALAPGEEKRLNLTVRVNDNLDPNTVISNSAVINSNVATSTTAVAEVVVEMPSVTAQIYIKPDHIYRNKSAVNPDLMIVVHLPVGIGMGAVKNTPLVLTPGNVQATGQIIFGSSTQGKVLGFFDVDPILAATLGTQYEYGECPVQVVGQLNDGRSFVAQGSVWIVK